MAWSITGTRSLARIHWHVFTGTHAPHQRYKASQWSQSIKQTLTVYNGLVNIRAISQAHAHGLQGACQHTELVNGHGQTSKRSRSITQTLTVNGLSATNLLEGKWLM
jgi:hypothetical protein